MVMPLTEVSRRPARLRPLLNDVILQTITRNKVCKRFAEGPVALRPRESDYDHTHIITVGLCDGHVGADRDAADIGDAPRRLTGRKVIGEAVRDKAWRRDLVPVVEPKGFEFLEENLRCPQILARGANGLEARGHARVERDEDNAHYQDAEETFDEPETTNLRLLCK